MKESRLPAKSSIFAAALAALALSGCAMSDERAINLMVGEGAYTTYSCDDIARAIKAHVDRINQLRGLMAKAETGPGGDMVNAIAYRPEYLELRGELQELQRSATNRRCPAPPVGGAVIH